MVSSSKNEKEQGSADSQKILVEGEVVSILPGLEYLVKIQFQGMDHMMKCYVSGKMKSNFIQLDKGDQVRVEVTLSDIDKGRIVYRVTQRKMAQPPRRPKK